MLERSPQSYEIWNDTPLTPSLYAYKFHRQVDRAAQYRLESNAYAIDFEEVRIEYKKIIRLAWPTED